MAKSEKKGKISLLAVLLLLGLLPVLICSIILGVVSATELKENMENDILKELRVAAEGLRQYYEWDIINVGEPAYEHDYVDSLKREDVELTLFMGDTRYITSLLNESGQRNEGTQASPEIWAAVKAGSDYPAEGVVIGGKEYFVYYMPLKDGDGKVVGMAFAGEPSAKVNATINKVVMVVIILTVVLILIMAVLVFLVAKYIQRPIAEAAESTETVAQGDLTHHFKTKSIITEVAMLIQGVKDLQDNMHNVIGRVHDQADSIEAAMLGVATATETCNQAATGITGAITELSKGSMEMAESVQNIASSMTDMGDNINEVATLADSTSTIVSGARDVSEEAKQKLDELVSANAQTVSISDEVARGITESNEAVENIREAAETIASIASQTNLLALNASIEAARAGEAGKGFAVVADNIKNLAAQSDESAGEIQAVITDIITKSARNVSLAEQIKEAVENEGEVLTAVGDGFNQVEISIEESTRAMQQVTDKVAHINMVKEAVLDEISTLSSISEENAASTQETNASMQEMAANIAMIQTESSDTKSTADDLEEAVNYFTFELS